MNNINNLISNKISTNGQPFISSTLPVNSSQMDKSVAELTSEILKPSITLNALLEKITLHLSSGKSEEIKVNRLPDNLFREIAKEKGMTDLDIESHISFINSQYLKWLNDGVDCRIKKFTQGNLSGTIEYLSDLGTVITHFKRKIFVPDNLESVMKGKPLGEGKFAIVKSSLINISSQLEGSAWIADKTPKTGNYSLSQTDENDDIHEKFFEEGSIHKVFNNCKNVCKCYRVGKNGLLLEGMKCNLRSYLANNQLSVEEKLKMAQEIVHGVNEVHNLCYVHQDLHLENIFISYDNICKLGDFGSAQKPNEMNRKPINWKIASPKIISDTTFLSNFMSYCSNDLWALG
nr:protein kinase family protein [Parachlamydiaceae bacterium]